MLFIYFPILIQHYTYTLMSTSARTYYLLPEPGAVAKGRGAAMYFA